MKILFLQWNVYMEQDLEMTLQSMNISCKVLFYPFCNEIVNTDFYFEKHFRDVLLSGDYDAVFSFNFNPSASKCCNNVNIPYIAWMYDSGSVLLMPDSVLEHPTNYIFLFDGYEYEKAKKRGLKTVYHLPLAINDERIDAIAMTEEEWDFYHTEISFVGSLYPSDFKVINNSMNSYQSGVMNSIIDTQRSIYGEYYLDKFIHSIDMNRYDHKWKDNGFERMQAILCREITGRERIMLLSMLSKKWQVALYSGESDTRLENVISRGKVGFFEDAYKVYRASKINLNITFRKIVTGIPLRALDIMGAGGFLLSNYQKELASYFRPGIDCVLYEDYMDAMRKVQYYLQNEEERSEIARNGYWAVKQFTFKKQVEKIFNIVFSTHREAGVM